MLNSAFKRLAILAVALCVALCFTITGAAERKTVRVAVNDTGLFFTLDSTGNPVGGYGYEYLETIAAYADFDLKYVPLQGFANCLAAVEKGEADLFYNVSRTPEREERFLFSDVPMGHEVYYLYCSSDNNKPTVGDYRSLDGMRVGVTAGTSQIAMLEKWCGNKGIKLKTVPYTSVADKKAALLAGAIDLDLEVNMLASSDFAAVERIGSSEYYLAINKNRQDILKAVNVAQSILSNLDRFFVPRLDEKYFVWTVSGCATTKDEDAIIAAKTLFTVGYMDKYLPFSTKGENGEPTGMLRELMPMLRKAYGLSAATHKLKYVCFEDNEQMYKALREGSIDLAFPVYGDLAYAKSKGALFSNKVLGISVDLAYTGKFTKRATEIIAVNKNNQMQLYYTKKCYPRAKVLYYDSIDECLDAVVKGEAGTTILNGLRTSVLLSRERYSALRAMRVPGTVDFGFAVKAGNTGLLTLLNRGLAMSRVASSISFSHSYVNSMEQGGGSYGNLPYIAAIVILLAVIAYLLWRVRKLQK